MTKAEMNRRLATMSPQQIQAVKKMIGEGFGALGITQNYSVTMKQVNAVFELVRREAQAK